MNAGTIRFSGSYLPEDVQFLLEPTTIVPTAIDDKERHIQSGTRHYSEMISVEAVPAPAYMAIYHTALSAGAARLGREIAALALALARDIPGPITLASLVRAGVPAGVLLRRALSALGRDVAHYGMSIIRDRGLDAAALRRILAERPADGLVFVDGWTGKGAIATELERDFHRLQGRAPRLVVLADPCGRAWLAGSGDDWLIPSGILGSTVSGLISRSILTPGRAGYHGCMRWDHLATHDVSRDFVDTVWPHVQAALATATPAAWSIEDRERHAALAGAAIAFVADRHGVDNPNRIKPGIAEATRAILRRKPERVLVASPDDPDLAALLHLAASAGIEIEILPGRIAPYRAITLIRKAG